MQTLRLMSAVTTGVLVSCVLAYVGAVIVLLATVGIPLGSAVCEPTRGEYTLYLGVAAGAAMIGARTAAGLAPSMRKVAVVAMAILLAGLMLWGFAGSDGWPSWWAPALASATGASALTAIRRSTRKP